MCGHFIKPLRIVSYLLTLPALALLCTPVSAQTPDADSASRRDRLVSSIQEAATKDAVADRPVLSPQDLNILYGEEARAAGVSPREVKQVYEDAYKAARNALPFYERYRPSAGWLVAVLLALYLFITKVWNDNIYPHIKEYNDRIYRKYAGLKVFHRKSLRCYRQKLVAEYEKFKPPFATERELDMAQVYVPLQIGGKNSAKSLDAFHALTDYRRLMVTGTPGSGKSMLLKRYALSYASGPSVASPKQPVPVLFPLRRLNEDASALEAQVAAVLEDKDFPKPQNFLNRCLKQGSLLLLFDGLDEVNSDKRNEAVGKIKSFLNKYDACWAVITCRTAVYDHEFNDVVNQTLDIQPFTDKEIQSFLSSWKSMPPGKSPEQLFYSLNEKPSIKGLARNPLLLTMMVILYSDLKTFELPHSRADFYKNAADAFLNLNKFREEPNSYLVPQKRLVLEHLALFNQDSGAVGDQDRISIDLKTIIRETERVLPELGLTKENAVPLLQEIKDQSGLLMTIDGGTRYQFSHLTLQEYFTASALKNNPADLLARFKKDPNAWRETVLLWCGLDHDSSDLIRQIHQENALTAFQCLADAVKIKSTLAEFIIDQFKPALRGDSVDEAVARTFALIAAGPYERSQRTFAFLMSELSADGARHNLAGVAKALSLTNKPQAADLLARFYNSRPEVRTPLIQMGDLAVESLVAQFRGGNIQVIDGLMNIGTPKAALALLKILWVGNETAAVRAAFRLATLFRQDNVLEQLRRAELDEAQRSAPYYEWVWKPFNEPPGSALPVIAGRIVYLLRGGRYTLGEVSDHFLDARLAIPLAVDAQSSLHVTGASVGIAPERLAIKEALSLQGSRQSSDIPDAEGAKHPVTDRPLTELSKQAKDASAQLLIRIVGMVHPQIQMDLLISLVSSPEPTPADWENIRRPVSYKFYTSPQFNLLMSVLTITSVLSLVEIILSFKSPVFSLSNVFCVFSLVSFITVWLFTVLFSTEKNNRDKDADSFINLFFGVWVSFRQFVRHYKDTVERQDIIGAILAALILLLIFAYWPICMYFTFSFFLREVNWIFALLFWLCCVVSTFWLGRTALRKIREAGNTLVRLNKYIAS